MGFFNASSWAPKQSLEGPKIARCGACGLSSKCFSPRMAPTGRGRRKILFVGEAPGEQEDRKGTQLIGDAGQCLRRLLKGVDPNLSLDDCWKTNAVICRPPKNKIDDLYIDSCRPNLTATIRQLQPNVIILLGGSAVQSVIRNEWSRNIGPLEQWVGLTIPSPFAKAWVCPTYHPSYVLRMKEDMPLVKITRRHLQAALALEDEPLPTETLDDLKAQVEVILDPVRYRKRLEDLSTKEGVLAWDYEATGLKPDWKRQKIVACSFCLDGTDTFAGLVTPDHHKALSAVLQNKKLRKIGSNIKFEERWTRAKLGHGVAGWYWDTMLAAHVIDNRPGITSVKFQAYVLFGWPPYEEHVKDLMEARTANGINRIHEIHPKDLLVYNGLDSVIEYKVAHRQMEVLRAVGRG